MDNVLRETIRTEIKAILGDKESRNETPKTQTEKCRKKLTGDSVDYFQELDQRLHQRLTTQGR